MLALKKELAEDVLFVHIDMHENNTQYKRPDIKKSRRNHWDQGKNRLGTNGTRSACVI
jgi:hypothetical protein